MKKYIFVTGGVCSSLGKGIAAASIGTLLESRGYKVSMIKVDPYLNVDAGTMSPYQHGEVYVTDDGAETDLDLGNYARFTSSALSRSNSITTGQIYQTVINKEREGRYLGRTVQVIPHITDEIKQQIVKIGNKDDVDITIIEVGGTVGDIESVPFLEAARQLIHDIGHTNGINVHLTLIPEVGGGELKTKPTQHSVKELREIGIQPDLLLCRSPYELDDSMRRKIASFTNVNFDSVLSAINVDSTIYEIPLIYHQQKLDEIILKKLDLPLGTPHLEPWIKIIEAFRTATKTVKVAMVGKYIDLHDTYKSIDEALVHAGMANYCRIQLIKIDSEKLEKHPNPHELLEGLDAILVPGGFGERGVEGMILAAQYARKNNIPYLGICLGMQIMVIEYSRHVLGLTDANSAEFDPMSPHTVVSLLEDQVDVTQYGGTMRLGRMQTNLLEGSKIHEAYGSIAIWERHRHRFEFSNKYREDLVKAGLDIGGLTPDGGLVESVEWSGHPWGVGVQFHPEFTSRPTQPHPLFARFIGAGLKHVL